MLKNFKLILLFIAIPTFCWTQPSKLPGESVQAKTKELEQKINDLSFSDLQNAMIELNSIRAKLDDHLDFMSKNCQIIPDKDKEKECMTKVKNTLKNLWTQYFNLKEKYLNALYQHYLSENGKQAKSMQEFIDSLQLNRVKR
jgi:hypothetical protein